MSDFQVLIQSTPEIYFLLSGLVLTVCGFVFEGYYLPKRIDAHADLVRNLREKSKYLSEIQAVSDKANALVRWENLVAGLTAALKDPTLLAAQMAGGFTESFSAVTSLHRYDDESEIDPRDYVKMIDDYTKKTRAGDVEAAKFVSDEYLRLNTMIAGKVRNAIIDEAEAEMKLAGVEASVRRLNGVGVSLNSLGFALVLIGSALAST